MEWKLKRIALLSLFFISFVEFFLEHGRIDLVLMTSTSALLLWSAVYSLRRSHTTRKRGEPSRREGRANGRTARALKPSARGFE
jgi:hypothetical protein